jgi:hypothetical protein
VRKRPGTAIKKLRSTLDGTLFAPAPPTGSSLGRWEAAIVLLAFLAMAIVLQLLRVGPSEALGAPWAEDGTDFLQGAIWDNFFDAVTSTYAGYLVVVQRLIGEVGGWLPLSDAPAGISLAACAMVAVSGLIVWFASAALIRSPYLRGALVALTVLSPVASLEAVASGAYAAWFMTFAAFWVFFWRPRSTWVAAAAGLFLCLTALSSPGLVFFVPLALLRAMVTRDRRDVLILGGFALGLAFQIPVTALSNEGTVTPVWTSDIWTSYLQRVLNGAALGEAAGGEAWRNWGWTFLIALLVASVAVLALALVRASVAARWFAAVAVLTSVVFFVASCYQRAVGSAVMWPPGLSGGLGGRYAIVPALLLVSVALVLVDWYLRSRSGAVVLWGTAATIAILAVSLVSSFDLREPLVRGTPSWDEATRKAAVACERKPLPGDVAAVQTAPPGFQVYVPCDRLASLYSAER